MIPEEHMVPNRDLKSELVRLVLQSETFAPAHKSILLELLTTRKRYGLVWEPKPEHASDQLRAHYPLPAEIADRHIPGTSPDSPGHSLIEGDNLHALTALQYSHAEQIDIICIDPPYNTGNRDFVYNDDYVDKEDGFRHSKWLGFMERRLKLARNLLKKSGVLYISIDENEQAQLKLLCDEIFGERNFVATLPTIMNLKGNQDEFAFAGTHETTLVYARSVSHWKPGQFPLDEDALEEWENDATGPYKKGANLKSTGVNAPRSRRPNLYFPIFVRPDREWYVTRNDQPLHPADLAVYPVTAGQPMSWRWSKAKFLSHADDVILSGAFPQLSFYKKQRPGIGELPGRKPKTLFYRPEYSSGNGTAELKNIFGGDKPFGNPKPLRLIMDFLRIGSTSPDALILDFFAGSGTTLHATMALNAEDGGKRRCILVTSNENRICENITYERSRRVIQGYTNLRGQNVPGLQNNALRYYQMRLLARAATMQSRAELAHSSVDLLRMRENCHRPVASPSPGHILLFAGNTHILMIILEPESISAAVEWIAAQTQPCQVYVFSPGAYAFDEEFLEVREQVNLHALPEVLYSALHGSLPSPPPRATTVEAPL